MASWCREIAIQCDNQFSFLSPRMWRHNLKIILSYQAGQDGCLYTLNITIHPLLQILETKTGWCKKIAKLQILLSYQAGQHGHLDTLNLKIHPLFQILETQTGWCKKSVDQDSINLILTFIQSRNKQQMAGKQFKLFCEYLSKLNMYNIYYIYINLKNQFLITP